MLLATVLFSIWFGNGMSYEGYECGAQYDIFESKIIKSLESVGYESESGSFGWYQNKSSYAANPSLYYAIFGFNRSNISLPNHITKNIFDIKNDMDDGYGSSLDIRGHEGINQTFYLYGSSAVIWYGCLPPSYYYAFLMYQNRRWNQIHPSINDTQNNDEKYPIAHPYSSLGDMLNEYNINKTNNGLTVIISTPDNKTYTDIKQIISRYLHELNLTNINQINLNIMPYQNISILGPGFGDFNKTVNVYYLKYKDKDNTGFIKQILERLPLDSFSLMGRSGLPFQNATQNGQFMKYLNTKQKIYKIYYNQSKNDNQWDIPREPFKKPYIVNVSTGIYEQDKLEPYFTNYVNIIYKYFNVEYKNKYYFRYLSTKISRPGYLGNNHYGFNCLKYATRCMADNRDSQYFVSWPDVQIMTNTSIFFILGVVHEDTGKAEWENIVPMFQDKGFRHKFYRSHYLDYLSSKYRYSAMTFPPNINKTANIPTNILNKFFIIAAMRPSMCSKYFDNNSMYPELKNIPKFCFDHNDYGYNESQNWFIVHRNYLNPITHTRSDANEMIPFVVMQFESQWFEFNTA